MSLSRVVVAGTVFALLMIHVIVPSVLHSQRENLSFTRDSLQTRGTSPEEVVLIAEVYYNALIANEFVSVFNPGEGDIDVSGWKLSDMEGTIAFPSGTILAAKAYVVIAQNSTLYLRDTLRLPDFSIDGGESSAMVKLGGSFQLRNEGDEVLLKNLSGEIVDVFTYGSSAYVGPGWSGEPAASLGKGYLTRRKTMGQAFVDTNTSGDWTDIRVHVIGQSSFSSPTFEFDGFAQGIVSPAKAVESIISVMDDAQESILLSLYEFTNWTLARSLLAALERGLQVKILMEGLPVGGIKESEIGILHDLAMAGADVHLMLDNSSNGVKARYRYNHAKYLVVDNTSVLVSSENWGASAFPVGFATGNRGWSVRLDNPGLAAYLAGVFLEDWNPARMDIADLLSVSIVPVPDEEEESESGTPKSFSQEVLSGHFKVTPVVGPDDTLDERHILRLLRSAKTSVNIEQFYVSKSWSSSPNLYLEEAIGAARRGVIVRILLDSSWYNTDRNNTMDNDDTVAYLEGIAKTEGIPLEAKLANAKSHGLIKFHNKGVVVDGEKVLVSSINWNLNSVTQNRELGLIIENADLASFFDNVFEHDWKDDVTPPFADAGDNLTVVEGTEVVLSSTGSRDDVGIVAYLWDIGGDGLCEANVSVVSYRFDRPGNYTVILYVEDAWGNSANDTIFVSVVPRPTNPTAGDGLFPLWVALSAGLAIACIIAAIALLRRK